jgi:hypothetical protein
LKRKLVQSPVYNTYIWNCAAHERTVLAMRGPIAGIALSLVLCATGLGQTNQRGTPTPQEKPQQRPSSIDIYEAVVRYQINSWELAADSYCVKVNGKDAARDLLERLQPLRVKGASGCREKAHAQVVDKKTGKISVIFDLGEIHWFQRSDAEVDGGYVCGTLCSAAGTYHIAWEGSRWIVTKFEIRFQS